MYATWSTAYQFGFTRSRSEQHRPLPSVIILQKDKSQLDEPVYHCLNATGKISLKVLYLNDYGIERVYADDELQLVPNFSDSFAAIYEKEWMRYDGDNLARLDQGSQGRQAQNCLGCGFGPQDSDDFVRD